MKRQTLMLPGPESNLSSQTKIERDTATAFLTAIAVL